MKIKPLTPRQYWEKYRDGTHIKGVLERAGTTYGYWKHIVNGRKRPGVALTQRLVEESGGELSVEGLRPDIAAMTKPASRRRQEATPA